jgi:hypothetical protein
MTLNKNKIPLLTDSTQYLNIQTEIGRDPRSLYPPTELLIKPRTRRDTYMRVAHFSPDAPNIDIYLGNRRVATNLSFGDQSDYKTISAGTHRLIAYPTGERDEPLVEKDINIPTGSVISTVSINRLEDIDLQLISDDISISPNETLLKFGNLAPDAPSVNLLVNRSLYFNDINYSEITDYMTLIPTGNYNIEVVDGKTRSLIVQVPNVILGLGRAYSIYLVGLMGGRPSIQIVTTLDGSTYFVD